MALPLTGGRRIISYKQDAYELCDAQIMFMFRSSLPDDQKYLFVLLMYMMPVGIQIDKNQEFRGSIVNLQLMNNLQLTIV